MSGPVRFAVVGDGWRSRFYQRVARMAPRSFQVASIVTPDAGSRAVADVPAFTSLSDALALGPEFVVVAVPRTVTAGIVIDAVRAGVPVLAETPPADDLAGLRSLWAAVGGSGLVQVAEQYGRMPGHAARLALVRQGVIGQPTSVEVASTHDYHAMSLIRGFLGVGMAQAMVTARSFEAPLIDPLTPQGWRADPRPEPRRTTVAMVDFGDGRSGLYNFVANQWWNPLRARRIVVRGEAGEIVDNLVVRWSPALCPVESPLMFRRTGVDMNLEGNELVQVTFDGEVVYRNSWIGARFSEDDLAVTSMLAAMGAWVRGEGEQPYPLAQACQDHALGLAVESSARTGSDVRVNPDVWS